MITMTSSNSKSKQTRKAKTSILFQVKQHTQQNIEIGQSINIISLGTSNKFNKLNNYVKNQNISNNTVSGINTNKSQIRRTHQSGKLTIKLGSGNCIIGEEQQNRIASLHTTNTQKKLDKLHINDLVDKFQKRHLITLQRNKITTDVDSFTNICSEFLDKIDGLQLQNFDLGCKIKKYENYFKQLKIKQTPEALEIFLQPSSTKTQKNAQLKILNLQRKVETLNYIIKNYRSNNKEQVKQFQKKVNDYKPTIEGQLVQMLSQSNAKYQQISKLVQYFQKQYGKYYKQGNWIDLVRDLKDRGQQVLNLENKNKELLQSCEKLKFEMEEAQVYKKQISKLDKQVRELTCQLKQQKVIHQKLMAEKLSKQIQYDEILRKHQDLSYNYEALLPLQSKIKQKDEIIRKNSQIISRIQNQNTTLISKIGSLIKNSQSQLFNKQSNSIQTIQKCSTTIEELANRFNQQIQSLPNNNNNNKQLSSFIMHLYEKTKNSFQKIVQQYQRRLKESFLQNKQLKNKLNALMTFNKKRSEFCEDITQQIKNIQMKRKRCEESQSKIQIKQQCSSCINWILHWGQINSLYSQVLVQMKKLMETQ